VVAQKKVPARRRAMTVLQEWISCEDELRKFFLTEEWKETGRVVEKDQ
jgi:hypothetical protein